MAHKTQELVIAPNRLFAAADVLLRAINSPRAFDARVPMYIGPRRVGGTLSPSMFTPEELLEAMAMLIRMGFVPADMSARRTGPARDGLSRGGSHG